jgi:hypothetical protein
MLGLIVYNNTKIMPLVCKNIQEFNDAMIFTKHCFGLIYEYDETIESENKMKVISKCVYDDVYSIIIDSEIEQYPYDFKTICKECKKNNNMYDIINPLCYYCEHDTCMYCQSFRTECYC